MKKLVITGATGNVGQALLPLLLEQDVQVTALTRSPDKLTSDDPKLTVAKADLTNPDTYASALAGADAVFLLTDGTPEMESMQNRFIAASHEHHVPFLIKQSAMGAAADAPVDLYNMHYAVEEKLKASGVSYCIVRPNSFTQNLLAHAQSIKEQGAIYAPAGDGSVSYVDVRDVAQAIASILLSSADQHRNQTYELTGPAAQSMQENADIVGELIGKKVQYYNVPPEQGVTAMQGFGLSEWLAKDLVAIAQEGAHGRAAQVTDAVEEITGTQARSVRDSLSDFQSLFQ